MREKHSLQPAPGLLRGLGTALGIWALCCLLLLLPPAGTILMVTFAPLAAGYCGGRSAPGLLPSRWLLLGASAGLIWSAVEAGMLLTILAGVLGAVDPMEPYGLGVLAAVSASNVLFCSLGARMGAAAAPVL